MALDGIIIPPNIGLAERRKVLERELRKVVEAQLAVTLQDNLKELLNEAGFTQGKAELEWEFYGEYDDEGGTDYYPSGISLSVNGEELDMDEHTFMHKGWGDEPYEVELGDYVRDTLCDLHTDLYEVYLTEVTIELGEE